MLGIIGSQQLQAYGWFSGLQSGLATFITAIFAFLPNLIAALIILLVGYLIVRGITMALRWGMNKANLEKHIGHTRLGQGVERSGHTFTDIVVNVVKYLLLFVVIVYAVSALGIPALTATMMGILSWIPSLIGVAILVFAGLLIGSWIGKGLENTLPRYGVQGGRIIGIIVEVLIYLFVFNLAVIQLGVGAGIVYVWSTAMAWGLAAALAIGFGGALLYALREVLPAMVSGTTTIASTLKPGQSISVEGMPSGNGGSMPKNGGTMTMKGRVSSVGMFSTVLEREEGGYLVIPNELLMDKPVTIEEGEAPRPFEHQVRDRVSDFHGKFEDHMESMSSNNSEQKMQSSKPVSSNTRYLEQGQKVTYEPTE